jgi:hypothetical protein
MTPMISQTDMLSTVQAPGSKPKAGGGSAALRETAGKVVGSVFLGKMLEMSRTNPLKGEYGHGGRGEEVFAAQLHQLYAEQLGLAQQNPLTKAMTRTYERQQDRIDRTPGIEA